MFRIVFLLSISFWLTNTFAAESSYHLCKALLFDANELRILQSLYTKNKNIDYIFLNDLNEKVSHAYILISASKFDSIKLSIQEVLLKCRPVENHENVDYLRIQVADFNRNDSSYSWSEYHELNDTYRWLRSLETKHPREVSVINVGRSFEDREILGVRISYRPANKIIFIDGGAHGQEWISPAVVNYITNRLLTNSYPEFRSIIESFDWYLVPHTNPDGYVRTHQFDRFWRKTVTPQESCIGVDFNRNWDFKFNEEHVTRFPCLSEYPGLRPFTEKETSALSNYLNSIKDFLFFYMSIDGPDNKIYLPNNVENIRNIADLNNVLNAGVDEIKRRYGTHFNGTKAKRFQPKSGTSMDWVYEKLNVNYSFTFHLPPAYEYEKFDNAKFLMPSTEIEAIGNEVFTGLIEMVKTAESQSISSTFDPNGAIKIFESMPGQLATDK